MILKSDYFNFDIFQEEWNNINKNKCVCYLAKNLKKKKKVLTETEDMQVLYLVLIMRQIEILENL